MSRLQFVQLSLEKQKKTKEKSTLREQQMLEVMQKIGLDKKYLPNPLPSHIQTFEHLLLKDNGNESKSKGKLFGTSQRFSEDPQQKWKAMVEKYNASGPLHPLNAQTDSHPSPAAYSLISDWTEKINKNSKGKNYVNKLSHTPVINPYYSSSFNNNL